MSDASSFSPDYLAARARFRSAALALGCDLESHPIGETAPDGTPLTLDVARLGADEPTRAVAISSGLHGVEGFLGSAIQVALLEDHLGGWRPSEGLGVVLLHALNPYGFAWLRRVDQDNIDLNRNFLLPGQQYTGSPPGYAELDRLLNPRRPPRRASLFLPRAVATIAKNGMPTLKNAVAGGQYDFPQGLFYGGAGPSVTFKLLDAHLPRWVGGAERVLHVDFHSGLGRRGAYKLLVDHPWGSPGVDALARIFGGDVVEPWEPKSGISYEIRGGMGVWCKARLPDTEYDVLTAEFGTVSILKVIAALRQENRAHHWARPESPAARRAKARLKDVFAPPERAWRDTVVGKGTAILQRALDALS